MQSANNIYAKDDTSYIKEVCLVGIGTAVIGLGMRKIYPAQNMKAFGKLISLLGLCGGISSATGYPLRQYLNPDQGPNKPLNLKNVALYSYGSSLIAIFTTAVLLKSLPKRAYLLMMAGLSIRPTIELNLAYQYNQQLKSRN